MKKKHKISDSKLSTLWSHAVKAKYKRCPITGQVRPLESHHIVAKGRQNRFALRWDIRNGVPLHPTAHRAIHDGDLDAQRKLIDYVTHRGDKDYLMELKHKLKPDFLRDIGLTEEEYRAKIKAELEEAIHE